MKWVQVPREWEGKESLMSGEKVRQNAKWLCILKALTKNRKMNRSGGKNIQIKKEWEANGKVLVLMINRDQGIVMKIPGTIENKSQLEKVRACWNFLMNTLGVGIVVEKNARREWIFKDRNTGGKSKIVETLSHINSGTGGNYSNFKEKPRGRSEI